MKWLSILLLLSAVSIGVLMLLAARNDNRTTKNWPPSGQFVDVNGKRLHLEITGKGPPIVLIHGASGNLNDLTFRLAPALADRFTVIAIDRPGLGYSPAFNPKGETLAEQADLIAAALRKLGYDKAYVLGQSYGGSVALRLTLDQPDLVAGLVLVSAPSNVWSTDLGTLYSLTSSPYTGPIMRLLIAAVTPDSVVQSSLDGIFEPQAVPEGYGAFVGTGLTLRRSQQRANALQVAALKEQVREMVPRYGEISVPVEAIHGTADTIVPYKVHTEKLARQIADINVTVLDGVGHMPHQTNTADVVAAIDRLANRVGLKSAP
jgi:pimeloyl-ACP methyl ester carboxylesterase